MVVVGEIIVDEVTGGFEVVEEVDVVVGVEVVPAQEAKTIAKIMTSIIDDQITLLFIFLLHFSRVIKAIPPCPQSAHFLCGKAAKPGPHKKCVKYPDQF